MHSLTSSQFITKLNLSSWTKYDKYTEKTMTFLDFFKTVHEFTVFVELRKVGILRNSKF